MSEHEPLSNMFLFAALYPTSSCVNDWTSVLRAGTQQCISVRQTRFFLLLKDPKLFHNSIVWKKLSVFVDCKKADEKVNTDSQRQSKLQA